MFRAGCHRMFAAVAARQPVCLGPVFHTSRSAARHCSNTSPQSCWSCDDTIDAEGFFCGCEKNVVLPVNPKRDYFSILGCTRSFTLDSAELQKSFRRLQTQLHPDKFSNQPQQAQTYSADQSSLVNNAFQTLSSPLSRGLYMLQLGNMAVEDGTTSTDQTFLMHVMDLNDSLDAIESEQDLTEFLPEVQELIESCTGKAAAAFEQENLEVAREQICQLKYFVNLERRAKDKLLAADIAS
ncbi:iron-sulfur cluster co-chaperone protein HscB-like [Sycon ciliatum]|uniref:iron-sulfur cluster co-chaperone protein HscB-like n=1 Tax=Sycon ciliatum TaxID=27933 RepID=UPI0020ACA1FA|eukprot:scpid86146/ scgid2617/ Iron-sulfur cluster co-chaperone protein HscB, mitochondrial; Hsc20